LKRAAKILIKVNGNYLLDTNIIVAIFRPEPEVVAKAGNAKVVYLPVIVIGELYFGALKSQKNTENTARLEQFMDKTHILDCNKDTAKEFGKIKHLLIKAGTPIPENDIWIAAIAMQYKLTLVSRDKHFQNVEGLEIIEW